MKIKFVKPSFEITLPMPGLEMLKHIEKAGRTCYKSEDKITDDSAEKFVAMLIKRGHESVLEHCGFSVRFICDRGVSHELVRHRIASFSQESTRYVGYQNAMEFIIPPWLRLQPCEFDLDRGWYDTFCVDTQCTWINAMQDSAHHYLNLIEAGWRPEQARSVLPNSLKTEIVMTANCREWRTVLKVRDHAAAHPQMREIMEPFHIKISGMIPGVFE
jgi:thymidylate synthase (FAD)